MVEKPTSRRDVLKITGVAGGMAFGTNKISKPVNAEKSTENTIHYTEIGIKYDGLEEGAIQSNSDTFAEAIANSAKDQLIITPWLSTIQKKKIIDSDSVIKTGTDYLHAPSKIWNNTKKSSLPMSSSKNVKVDSPVNFPTVRIDRQEESNAIEYKCANIEGVVDSKSSSRVSLEKFSKKIKLKKLNHKNTNKYKNLKKEEKMITPTLLISNFGELNILDKSEQVEI